MDNNLISLTKLFTEKLFRIPDYQRGYAWTERQLQDFWNDIEQLADGSNHYTGVLTLELIPDEVCKNWEDDYWVINAKSFEPFYVVDGQQRLTTSLILLQTIIEAIDDNISLNYFTRLDIQKRFIFDSKDGGISRSYIFGYEKDNPSYEYLKTAIFGEYSSASNELTTIYAHNLEYAKEFFSTRISSLSHSQLERLFKKVTQHLKFNIFTIAEDVDVCVAFETMNNRGKPLSYLELLKNRLIYLSLIIDEDEMEKATLRKSINNCWKSIYHNLGRNKDNPLDDDKFLTAHFFIHFFKESENIPNRELHFRLMNGDREFYAFHLLQHKFIARNVIDPEDSAQKISIGDIHQYVTSLQRSVDYWYYLFNPMHSKFSEDEKIWLDKLNRIGIDLYIPLILVFFMKESNTNLRLHFLQAVERYMFILLLVRYRYRSAFFLANPNILEMAYKLNQDQLAPASITKSVNEHGTQLFSTFAKKTGDTVTRFKQDGYYKWDGIRYFLYEYNLHLQEQSKTKRRKINWAEFTENVEDYVTIEHIYPQRPRHPYWKSNFSGLTASKKKALKESLGNLLPLSKSKNSSLSNKPFPEKIDSGNGSTIGFRYGCYAENEVAALSDWTPNEILKRGLSLLNFMEFRWGIKLGDRDMKLKWLGLKFMKG